MESDHQTPMNIGSDHSVTINELVDIVSKIDGKKIEKKYLTDKPQGVRGRNSDNTLFKSILDYENQTSLEEGLYKTYQWIKKQVSHE